MDFQHSLNASYLVHLQIPEHFKISVPSLCRFLHVDSHLNDIAQVQIKVFLFIFHIILFKTSSMEMKSRKFKDNTLERHVLLDWPQWQILG